MSTRGDTLAVFRALPDGLGALIELGAADPDEISKLSREALASIARRSRDELVRFSLADLGPPPPGGETRHIGLARIAIVLGTHYQAAMKVLVLKQDEHQAAGLAPPSYFDALTEVASKFPHAEETPDPLLVARATLAAVTRSLLGCWTLAAALRNASGSLPASDLREIAGSAMEGATLLFELPSLLNEEAALLADLCNCVASPTADGVVDALRANQQRADLTQITFAALRLADIHRLSRRDAAMKEIYDMPIERAFERQLSLLFTSFGFAVIDSKPGNRSVDLLCIGDTPEPSTILIEAKSTAANEYKFPAAHERALVNHVGEVRRTLRSLPPLLLVLVIAPRFSAGSAGRLEAVSRAVGVACHGFPVDLLVDLRNNYLGPLPLDVLIEETIKGPRIVDGPTAERILRIAASSFEGWKQLVTVQRQARESA